MDKRIFHIKQKLSQTMGDSWFVGKMADEVRMSIPNFQRLFKEHVKVTPKAYLNDLRLEEARERLADPHCFLQIKEIAFQVGLSNDSHFTHGFKLRFGKTPTEYRRYHAEIHQSVSPDGQD